ncbi:hypothetical protein E2562_032035 [Oryza meyeriana var. granulata]|uniref:Uncharacterized protein n=1 Tax=Oryza meyeriana var. granulata TaxID=110450 RepID=A0A6G1FEN0_9ORYZ|nr:hypothetical protein E2562_032035 [Oryza meyeriana var. granulata]
MSTATIGRRTPPSPASSSRPSSTVATRHPTQPPPDPGAPDLELQQHGWPPRPPLLVTIAKNLASEPPRCHHLSPSITAARSRSSRSEALAARPP